MNRLCSINNNFPYDNNLLVLDMVLSSLWASQQPISWENVAKLVPGFTAKECAQRYEELKTTGSFPHVDEQCNLQVGAVGSPSEPFTSYIKSNSLDIAREKRDTQSKPGTPSESGRTGVSSGQEMMVKCTSADSAVKFDGTEGNKNPNMVIHVCDEAKNLKQDFVCRRKLLVKGMRYFEEYLSVDPQRWDEVDISVHCDIQIFDWLMNYVKSSEQPEKHAEKPRLEHSNVISILISSEFLKMDALVEECVQYCHQHMNAIIATPCNMNCINNNLAGCIADLFSHNEADDLKDKKDKFKSKLFQKKIERLFDADYQNHDSPGSASTLYRCGLCLKLLTKDTERKVPCIPNKINIDIRGNILFTHSRQKTWEVHEYLHGLYEELKSWVLVYWRIWGTINILTCSRCKQAFLCTELGQCKYHPDPAVYPGMGAGRGVGIHPCCNQKVLRFDPYSTPKGCQIRDHDVSSTDAGDCDGNCSKVVNDLLLHRDSVLSSAEHPSGTEDVPEADVMLKPGTLTAHKHREPSAFSLLKNWSLQLHQRSLLSEDEEYTTGSEVTEDEVGDEDDTSKKQAAKKTRKPGKPLKRQVSSPNFHRKEKRREKAPSRDSTPFTVSIQKNKWDSNRSLRFNQDAQREEDQRRMEEIIANLTKMRFGDQEHTKIRDTKEPAGGLYSKLEAQLRVSSQSSGRHNSSEKTTRAKIRSGPSRPT